MLFIGGDLAAMLFNLVASIITKWLTFGYLGSIQNLHQSTCVQGSLYAGRNSSNGQLLIKPFS
jgi:hypothetical protein